MTAEQMIRARSAEWRELEALLSSIGGELRRSATNLSRFAALFRNVGADLALARAQGFPEELTEYLNSLAARAHNRFYVSPRQPLGQIAAFFRRKLPLIIHRNARYVVIGMLLFFGPLLATVGLSRSNDSALFAIVPKSMLSQFERMYKKGHAAGRPESLDAAMTGFYVFNNVGIAFRCFATGVFAGLGSIFFLLYNGVVLGAVTGFVSTTPSATNLLSFIIGHGPFELFAIALSGGAGLRLGFGMIITGNRRRRDSLRDAAVDAVQIVLGAAVLLLGAALIEGFFSPSSLPIWLKFAFGGVCVLFLTFYFGILPWFVARAAGELRRQGDGLVLGGGALSIVGAVANLAAYFAEAGATHFAIWSAVGLVGVLLTLGGLRRRRAWLR
ncbi:MAG: stage II sporulation protein M [Deltaproteobacteria bacterium]|nr:stage II sporulation protein M [Deltaproteobacteria bacterium]